MWARPTCDVNGLVSGYGGEGAKTIIPANATAKVSMRLVPNQDAEKIAAAFQKYVMEIAPKGVRVEVENLHNAAPVLVPRKSEMMQAGMTALEKGFGAKPVFIREGGSIPIVGTFQDCLKSPVLLLGYGLSTDNIHSPNEKFHLENFWRGARTSAMLMVEAAK
jgi:acetylornithine deacetylase/succinyl-diaminopimelate desuccinylase-like protein